MERHHDPASRLFTAPLRRPARVTSPTHRDEPSGGAPRRDDRRADDETRDAR